MPKRLDWRAKTALAAVSTALLCFAILVGTRAILNNTIDTTLRSETEVQADHLVKDILAEFPELIRVATDGKADQKFLSELQLSLLQKDYLIQLKVFNSHGVLRYVFDETYWINAGGGTISLASIAVGKTGDRAFEVVRRPSQDAEPERVHTRTIVPALRDNGGLIGTLEITLDQTATAKRFTEAFAWLTVALPLMAALYFLVPTLAWFFAQKKNAQNETLVKHLARRDRLTGLMNRTAFTYDGSQIFTEEFSANFKIGLLILDVDRFRSVNDNYGHDVGDAFLRNVASVLTGAVRDDDIVARFDGDEFVALLPDVSAEDLNLIGQRILDNLKPEFHFKGINISIAASLGTYLSRPGDTLDTAMHAADLALSKAKSSDLQSVVAYTDSLDHIRARRHKIEACLRDAWQERRAHLVFQPVVHAKQKNIAGFEALIRMRTDDGEELSPEEFIPIAEQTGIINELGLATLRRAMEEALKWPDDTFLAVNLSPAQFGHGDLVEQVRWLIDAMNFPVSRLEFEITENLPLDDEADVRQQFLGLKDLGVSIAMDDFGTGHSSLSYLLSHDFDKLKIDRMFLNDFETDPVRPRNILSSIVALGHQIGLTVTMEGVETVEQQEMLAEIGCNLLQGFHFHRPLSAQDIDAMYGQKDMGGAA